MYWFYSILYSESQRNHNEKPQMANKKLLRFLVLELENVRIGCNGKQIGVFGLHCRQDLFAIPGEKLSIQRTRYTIITPAMTILIIRTNIIYRIKDLFLWNNNVQR
mgnify:CR=1 FL=1